MARFPLEICNFVPFVVPCAWTLFLLFKKYKFSSIVEQLELSNRYTKGLAFKEALQAYFWGNLSLASLTLSSHLYSERAIGHSVIRLRVYTTSRWFWCPRVQCSLTVFVSICQLYDIFLQRLYGPLSVLQQFEGCAVLSSRSFNDGLPNSWGRSYCFVQDWSHSAVKTFIFPIHLKTIKQSIHGIAEDHTIIKDERILYDNRNISFVWYIGLIIHQLFAIAV